MMNPLRTGLITTLLEMGADIERLNERDEGGETVADLRVRREPAHRRRRSRRARAPVDDRRISRSSPSPPPSPRARPGCRACTSCASRNPTASPPSRRVSRRPASPHEIEGDDLIVHGLDGKVRGGGGPVATHLDHRIAMAFLVMGLATARADDGR